MRTPTRRLANCVSLPACSEMAIDDARRGDPDAIAWFAGDDDTATDRGWGYVAVCHQLQVDPGWLRGEIAEFVAANPYVHQPRNPRRVAAPVEQAAAA